MKKRFNKQIYIEDCEKYIIIFNAISNQLTVIDNIEDVNIFRQLRKNINSNRKTKLFDDLCSLGVIVDSDFDEYAYVKYLYNNICTKSRTLKLYISPTNACNFRCKYCYVCDSSSPTITSSILDGTIHFIEKQIEAFGYNKIVISWFGGEPTLCETIIVDYMKKLSEKFKGTASVEGYVTTNGYLLNEQMFNNFTKSNIVGYQITVDGYAETHNKLRVLHNGDPTWETVIKNLKYIHDNSNGIDVIFRINYNEEIVESIFDFIDYVSKNFYKFKIHIHPISHLSDDSEVKDCVCDTTFAQIAKVNLYQHFAEFGINNDVVNTLSLFGGMCYASMVNSFFIVPNGDIMKCTVAVENEKNIVGKIFDKDNFVLYQDKLSKWVTYKEHRSECKKCWCFPICFGISCPKSLVIDNSKRCQQNKTALSNFINAVAKRALCEKNKVFEQ